MIRMRRRGIVAAAASFPLAAVAQSPARIAWIVPIDAATAAPYVTAFNGGMRERGLLEGRHYVLDLHVADGHYDRFPSLVDAALRRGPAVIIATTIASIGAAQRATQTVPIVFISTNDPVGSGLVASLARPGGNTTGISNQAEDAVTKYVELLREALPQARRVAVLLNPGNRSNPGQFARVQRAAHDHGIAARQFEAATPESLEGVFAAIVQHRPDAVLMISDAMLLSQRERIASFALRQRLPSIAPWSEGASAGFLFSYGTSRLEQYRFAATYVAKILAGARPADLPVEQPTTFDLVINLRTARALGIVVPQVILLRADEVIE